MAICPNCNAQGELAKECQNCGGGWHYIENKNLSTSDNDVPSLEERIKNITNSNLS